jgi:hypothetical protein
MVGGGFLQSGLAFLGLLLVVYVFCILSESIVFSFVVFLLICFYTCYNTLSVAGFSPSGSYVTPEGREVCNLSWPLRG